MAHKAVHGAGSIRKKTVTRSGKEYTYWEARYTSGRDPGTGKQVQRSITGKTQREVSEKLRAITASIDTGTYSEPSKLTLGAWLDIWLNDYLGDVKPHTVASYSGHVKNHIKPALGAVKLEALTTPAIQKLYNQLQKPRGDAPALSAKTIKNIHGVLHKALEQAVAVKYLRFNPADACKLPRIQKREIHPFSEADTRAFLQAIKGNRYEALFTVVLFTGMREGEVLGLGKDRVNLKTGKITIDRQLQKEKKQGGEYRLVTTKNEKSRSITPAAWVMGVLKHHLAAQAQQRLKAGELWEDSGLVFTDELGRHLREYNIYREFKRVAEAIGRPDARFHDLRHTYAVNAIRAGDDIRTVSGNLGHATVAFTMDVYADFTEDLKRDSAARMDTFIKDVLSL